MTFDYEEGYREDTSIRKEVDGELNETITAANELVENGYTDTEFHSPIRQGTLTRTVSWKVGEEPGDSHDDESRDRNDWRGGWDNGGGRYPRHEPGGDDQANRYPDGRQY
ncbi:hypothetical protein D4740_10815 [Actinomyces sp. 2119]|uniref:hypothetical protein n=1 Tax=Actinomyces sp. 2119 TaxID=2321393 RepID=UPI000E6BC91F|nr:hypothetical protein [Actinomyces sp. 2119]RJF40656.1 hypothetical protein D4740_10815 [Actinomyces sp. 2119]